MDALSDVLQNIRLGGAVYLQAELTAPWGVIGESDASLCSTFLPPSERVIAYHLVLEGECWARLIDDPSAVLHVGIGELLVVPQGEAHFMGSSLDVPGIDSAPLRADQLRNMPGEVLQLRMGGGGEKTRLLCGFLGCNEILSNPLVSALPKLFKVDMHNDPRAAWIQTSMDFAATEAGDSRAGSSLILGKLSELLFIEAIRRCIDTLPQEYAGWLAGVRDRFIGRALALLHAQPSREWTVEDLAARVGLSRSAFAQRFTDIVGKPPRQYLTQWRLQLAANHLMAGTMTLADIAEHVGYESEAAFNHAFKRQFGLPPAKWRSERLKGLVLSQ